MDVDRGPGIWRENFAGKEEDDELGEGWAERNYANFVAWSLGWLLMATMPVRYGCLPGSTTENMGNKWIRWAI